jgi:hypothetical protein
MWVVLVQLGHSTHEMITGDPLQLSCTKLHQRIAFWELNYKGRRRLVSRFFLSKNKKDSRNCEMNCKRSINTRVASWAAKKQHQKMPVSHTFYLHSRTKNMTTKKSYK